MGFTISKTNGKVSHALLSEIADLALSHGHNEFAELPEELSLSRWYERARALASLMPVDADIALTHGSEWNNDHLPLQENYLKTA